MRKTLCLILMSAGAVLVAQAPATAPPMVRLLEMGLQELKIGTLIVLDDPKGEWKPKVDAMVSDPAWIDLELSIRYYGQKAPEVGAWLMAKHGVGPGPCWALFAEKGRLVASGTTVPKTEAIATAAQEAGIKTSCGLLREFLRTNPDHLEAQQVLLRLLTTKASTKMKVKLGEKLKPVRPADEKQDFEKYRREYEAEQEAKEEAKAKAAAEKPPQDLQAEEDQAIWGEVADRLAVLFRSGDWALADTWGNFVPSEIAARSPRIRDVSLRALPEVEAALARRPNEWSLWSIWLALSKMVGGRPIRPLLDSLTPPN
ncbi:MAG: hypothetical protein IPQ13_06625 [Holophagaceae bacterium]|nr:hypothetical protein [Holophagaceae bacterium]